MGAVAQFGRVAEKNTEFRFFTHLQICGFLLTYFLIQILRDRAVWLARLVHTQKVGGSNPPLAIEVRVRICLDSNLVLTSF